MSDHTLHFILIKVSLAHFQSDGGTSLLPHHALVLEGLSLIQVDSHADTACFKSSSDFFTLGKDSVLVIILVQDGNDDYLSLSGLGRQDKSLVVGVNHNHSSNRTGRETPRSLPDHFGHTIFVLVVNLEHFSEVVSEHVGSSSLNSTTRYGDVKLNCLGIISSRESLFV